jgi:hypothetical protein
VDDTASPPPSLETGTDEGGCRIRSKFPNGTVVVPRRSYLSATLAALLTASAAKAPSETAIARAAETEGTADDGISDGPSDDGLQQRTRRRTRLLQVIGSKDSSEGAVMEAIDGLLPYDPSGGRGATLSADLDGEWRLLWSAKAEAFSPLLKLPPPFRPESYQYLGGAAAGEVGPDRVAQGLTGGSLLGPSREWWLSSGVRPSPTDPSVLEILPPFRFELGGPYRSGTPKRLVVEAGSDAEFRKLNGRTSQAQAAPKNTYRQAYLERNGKGSLRISTITGGDPVIVGAVFVHEKM